MKYQSLKNTTCLNGYHKTALHRSTTSLVRKLRKTLGSGSWCSQKWASGLLFKPDVLVHGIPECGKTVLAASLAEEAQRFCGLEFNSRPISVYYYCHHSQNTDKSMSFLQWTVSRLCREAKSVPTRLYGIYKWRRETTMAEMLACMQEASH